MSPTNDFGVPIYGCTLDEPDPPTTADVIERYGEPDDMAQDPSSLTNVERAEMVLEYVATFARENYTSEETATIVGDMISNLLHLVTYLGGDAEYAYASGWNHFVAEAGMGYEE